MPEWTHQIAVTNTPKKYNSETPAHSTCMFHCFSSGMVYNLALHRIQERKSSVAVTNHFKIVFTVYIIPLSAMAVCLKLNEEQNVQSQWNAIMHKNLRFKKRGGKELNGLPKQNKKRKEWIPDSCSRPKNLHRGYGR